MSAAANVERNTARSAFPRMLPVRQLFPPAARLDLPTLVRHEIAPLAGRLKPGSRVAVGVGSRGIANLSTIVRAVLDTLKSAQVRPFIIPAMGSHGGGTPDGQTGLLAEYGVTEAAMGAPIEAALDVERVGQTADGLEVCCSRVARRADAVILVNRVKPHTDFSGAIGSGLLKMLVVGLGKRVGAANFHAGASRYGYERVLRQSARILLEAVPLAGGLAIVEDQTHATAKIVGLAPAQFESAEAELCAQAHALMPRLPFDEVDLLIVDRLGKNISGSGMDPAVVGRTVHGYLTNADPQRPPPRIRRLFVRDLTPESHGNGVGVGLADFTTARLVRAIDWEITRVNALTALSLQSVKVPIHYETDREAISVAMTSLALPDTRRARVARIADTLSLERLDVSEAYLPAAGDGRRLELLGSAQEIQFDSSGNLQAMA